MKAAAAARTWWAALRRRSREPASGATLNAAATHVSSYVLMALAVAMLACAVAGLTVPYVKRIEDTIGVQEVAAALRKASQQISEALGALPPLEDQAPKKRTAKAKK